MGDAWYRKGACFVVACVLLLGAAPAWADDIQVISFGASGPSKSIPVGSEFYLEGKPAETTTQVQLVYVRYSFAPWGLNEVRSPKNCAEAEAYLGKVNGARLRTTAAGTTTVDSLFACDGSDAACKKHERYTRLQHEPAMVVGPWKATGPGPNKEGTRWKLLTPDSSFFQVGAQYCLFVYETKAETSSKAARAIVDAWHASRTTCKEEDTTCRTNADEVFRTAVKDLAKGSGDIDGAVQTKIEDLKQKLLDLATKRQTLVSSRENAAERVRELAKHLGTIAYAQPAPIAGPKVDGWAAFVIGLLARDASIVRDSPDAHPATGDTTKSPQQKTSPPTPKDAPRGAVEFATRDGKTSIQFVSIQADRESVRVATVRGASRPTDPKKLPGWEMLDRVMKVKLKDIALPGSTATLGDLLDLHDPNGELALQLEKDLVLSPEARDLSDEALQRLATAVEKLSELRTFQKNALRECKGGADGKPDNECKVEAAGTDTAVWRAYGQFLRKRGLSCTAIEPAPQSRCKGEYEPAAWNGYASADSGPLDALVAVLVSYRDAATAWAALDKAVVTVTLTTLPTTSNAYEITTRLSEDAWLGTYVTPVTGIVTACPLDDDCMTGAMVGIQLFLWPNPVESPMWSNGAADFRRAFALELGMGTASTELGPGNRYAGPIGGDLPPLYFGIAGHFIPYTTISGGLSLLSRRRSTLPEEESALVASPYVNVAVELNVPDIIAKIVGRGSSTTVEK